MPEKSTSPSPGCGNTTTHCVCKGQARTEQHNLIWMLPMRPHLGPVYFMALCLLSSNSGPKSNVILNWKWEPLMNPHLISLWMTAKCTVLSIVFAGRSYKCQDLSDPINSPFGQMFAPIRVQAQCSFRISFPVGSDFIRRESSIQRCRDPYPHNLFMAR